VLRNQVGFPANERGERFLGDHLSPKRVEGAPSEEVVRACVRTMLAAPQFSDSPQLSSFLSFIVDETLKGRGSDLKGYSIATLALGRPGSFDPQTDPIVRVQAGRLRQALAEYAEAYPREPLVISLEKGTYVPRFVARGQDVLAALPPKGRLEGARSPALQTEHATPSGGPAVRVEGRRRFNRLALLALAFVGLGALIGSGYNAAWRTAPSRPSAASAALPERFTPSLIVEADAAASEQADLTGLVQRARDAVARFDDIVIVHDIADMVSSLPRASQLQSGSVLTLRINALAASGRTVRFNARLVDQADQAVIWSREFDPVPAGSEGDRGRTKVVEAIATAIAQPYGVIHAHVRSKLASGARKDDPYGCIVAGFDYWRTNDSKTHGLARSCLIQRIAEFPGVGSLHAQLTYLYLEEYRQGYNPMPGSALDRALESAKRAVTLSPASARSQQALLAAHFARGEMESAWRAAGEAMRLNPFDTEIIADVGARHVQSGHYEKGLGMLEQALELNPSPPTWAATFRAMAYYLLGRLDQSGPLASTLGGNDYPPAMIALILVARQQRDALAGKAALARMQLQHPGIVSDPAAYLRRLSFDQGTIDRIVQDFRVSRDWAAQLP
jgi:tetratricopeptide (TPR) repeat protein